MNMIFERKLPIPQEVKKLFPISENGIKTVERRAREIRDIFEGKSDMLIL